MGPYTFTLNTLHIFSMQVLALVAFIVAVTMTVSCLHAALMPYACVHAALCTAHVHTYIHTYVPPPQLVVIGSLRGHIQLALLLSASVESVQLLPISRKLAVATYVHMYVRKITTTQW